MPTELKIAHDQINALLNDLYDARENLAESYRFQSIMQAKLTKIELENAKLREELLEADQLIEELVEDRPRLTEDALTDVIQSELAKNVQDLSEKNQELAKENAELEARLSACSKD